jgi:hypothetical protein
MDGYETVKLLSQILDEMKLLREAVENAQTSDYVVGDIRVKEIRIGGDKE